MKIGYSEQDTQFRREIRGWLESELAKPENTKFRKLASSWSDDFALRMEWEKILGRAGLSCIAWPRALGGRDASLSQQAIFLEEYTRSGAPNRVTIIGVEFAGPTLMIYGTEEQKKRFLPKIAAGEEVWAQGFSEPNAGSDLTNVQTRARLEDGPNGREWVFDGQKIWTSFGHVADWIFVLCRTEPGSRGPQGLSYILVPLRQPGITVRPIRQITGGAEFNEVFFDGARCPVENVVGAVGDGWKVAISTLTFERGISTFGAQLVYEREYEQLVSVARERGRLADSTIRSRLMDIRIGLTVMKANSQRIVSNIERNSSGGELLVNKLFYTNLHQKLSELALDIVGAETDFVELEPASQLYHPVMERYLSSRSDSIGAGTDQVQRNAIAERVLRLPKEPRPTAKA